MKLDIGGVLRPRLVNDAGMQALFPAGAVALYYRMAKRDAPMPYMTWQLRLAEGDVAFLNFGSLVIDIWDFGANAEQSLRIAERVRALLDRWCPATPDTHAVTLWYESEGDVPTDVQNVWRTSLIFRVMAYDGKTADAIRAREEPGSGS